MEYKTLRANHYSIIQVNDLEVMHICRSDLHILYYEQINQKMHFAKYRLSQRSYAPVFAILTVMSFHLDICIFFIGHVFKDRKKIIETDHRDLKEVSLERNIYI